MFAQVPTIPGAVEAVETMIPNDGTQLEWHACGDMVVAGWNFDGKSFTPPATVAPTLTPQQIVQNDYYAAVSAGVTIDSTSTPAINGTYSLTDSAILKMTSEQVYIATKGTFTNGGTSRAWLDNSGTPHVFTSTALFTEFAEAVASYEDALYTALVEGLASGTWTQPTSTITIA